MLKIMLEIMKVNLLKLVLKNSGNRMSKYNSYNEEDNDSFDNR